MTQHELNCAVADATGETLCDVRRMGFSVADPTETNFDPEPDCRPPQVIDWDDLEAQRFEEHTWSRHHEPTAA